MIVRENTKEKASNAEAVAGIVRAILQAEDEHDQDKEHFFVIGVDRGLKVKYVDLCSLGTLDSSLVHPREVFRLAILKAVSRIILAHNHPSNMTEPSKYGRRTTPS